MKSGKPTLLIRRAGLKDCRCLWFWRNNKEARKWSFNTREIPYTKHKEWFKQILADPASMIFIAYNHQGRIGQTRFDKRGDIAVISISINPKLYSKGWGSRIIRKTCMRYKNLMPGIKVVAEIDREHIASQKAFANAGFRLSGKRVKGRRKIYLFEL